MKKKIYRLKTKKIFSFCLNKICILLLFCFLLSSCTYRSFDEPRNSTNAASSASRMSDFDKQVKAMKTADFNYIFAFRRKDSGVFTSEDKQFIKANSHYATNRFTLTKDEKVIVAGSNFEFSEENLNALRENFDVEDFSKPTEELEKLKKVQENSNVNTKVNQNK